MIFNELDELPVEGSDVSQNFTDTASFHRK